MSADINEKVRRNPKFQELCRKRSTFAWTLSAVMLAIYYGFILVIAFAPKSLGTPLWQGATTTIGFPIGIAIIVSAFLLTGLYVRRANGEFDDLTRQIIEEAK
ncbi:DUF485 domain-containing protein [Caenispirillum bisanense]|uniref:DUF485 domain-containing protein n=1 Tax=Caenispirillum bisanense TaxID=414052 RepID=UPI0031D9AF61